MNRKVFLSSVYFGLEDLREELYLWGKKEGYDIWIFELVKTEDEWLKVKAPSTQAILIQEVREADFYIAIFNGRYGESRNHHYSDVSYTDLEFFEAFKNDKPIKCYCLEPFEPEYRLKTLLKIVENLIPNALSRYQSKRELIESIKKDIEEFFRQRKRLTLPNIKIASSFDKFTNKCVLDRQIYDDQEGSLKLLITEKESIFSAINDFAIETEILSIKKIESYQGQLHKALSIINILSSVPWYKNEHSKYLKLWDMVLSIWDKASAWYGLHGFVYFGKLAANNTSIAIRALIASQGESTNLKKLILTSADKTGCKDEWVNLYSLGGSIASEYYSISQMVFSKKLQEKYLFKAKDWVDVAERTYQMEQDWNKQANTSSIKGQILLRLGNSSEAIKVLEESLYIRQTYLLKDNYVAVGKSNLGYAYLKCGLPQKAEKLLLESLEILEKLKDKGFCVRTKVKLAEFYFSKREVQKGLRQLAEAEAICRKYGVKSRLDKYKFLLNVPKKIINKFWFDFDSIDVIETENGFKYVDHVK